ncbi:MAG TPA: uracil-DNA glycosylase [Candidatus Angelobacter sp.]|nr:uracil-DNA glycosylase [Candidatus Angelobacter sp.]
MPKPLDPAIRKQLAERVNYYREMGIYDFYRRPVDSAKVMLQLAVEETAVEEKIIAPKSSISKAPSTAPLPVIQDKPSALKLIREDIGDCTRCRLHKGRTNLVFGVGNVNADLMFIGEGPGADEDAQGEPFVGRAGQLLNNMISAMGLKREDVYIANVVKCRPPSNRTPEKDECDTCSPFLMRQIEVIRPKVIVALGAVAAKNLLAVNDSMANLRGRWYDFKGSKLAVTYHPAYLLRDPRQKKETWKDLQMVMKFLGLKPKPAPAGAE